jgi:predicted N-acyltransferase
VLSIIEILSIEEWFAYLGLFLHRVFWKSEYMALYKVEGEMEAAVYKNANGIIFYPYLKRKISGDWLPKSKRNYYQDITSAYGFGGPLIHCPAEHKEQILDEFRRHFHDYCRTQHIVTEFVRFHPLLSHGQDLKTIMNVEQKAINVFVDLDKYEQEEDFLQSYKRSLRKEIKKALRHELTVIRDDEGLYLDEFLEIYHHTLDRNQADDFYYFEREYFENLIQNLKGNFVFFHVKNQEKIISSELLLYDADSVYSFLGGTNSDYFGIGANPLLKHHVILWAKQQGIHKFLLGGGLKEGDGIFYYKKSFAPDEQFETNYFIGKQTHDENAYQELAEYYVKYYHNTGLNRNYYPVYRSVISPPLPAHNPSIL